MILKPANQLEIRGSAIQVKISTSLALRLHPVKVKIVKPLRLWFSRFLWLLAHLLKPRKRWKPTRLILKLVTTLIIKDWSVLWTRIKYLNGLICWTAGPKRRFLIDRENYNFEQKKPVYANERKISSITGRTLPTPASFPLLLPLGPFCLFTHTK